jgi:uncharacterized membrane protein YheB (UPF0754 family)
MEYGIYGTIAAVAVGVIVHMIRATWALSRVEKDISDYFDAKIDNIQRDIQKIERAGMDRAEALRHEFGETGAALRTKIHEVETWNRDTFVRKESFEMVVNRIEKSMEKAVDKIEKRIENMFERMHKPD